jgi:hypothetical protein
MIKISTDRETGKTDLVLEGTPCDITMEILGIIEKYNKDLISLIKNGKVMREELYLFKIFLTNGVDMLLNGGCLEDIIDNISNKLELFAISQEPSMIKAMEYIEKAKRDNDG